MKNTQKEFLVMKYSDIDAYLNQSDIEEFNNLLEEVEEGMLFDNRKKHNYMVINTDEPYADEIIAILKRHGHWGSPEPFPIPEGRCIRCGLDNQTDEHIDNCDPDPIERDQD